MNKHKTDATHRYFSASPENYGNEDSQFKKFIYGIILVT